MVVVVVATMRGHVQSNSGLRREEGSGGRLKIRIYDILSKIGDLVKVILLMVRNDLTLQVL